MTTNTVQPRISLGAPERQRLGPMSFPTWSAFAVGVAVDSQMAIEEIIIINAFLPQDQLWQRYAHTVVGQIRRGGGKGVSAD